jgi:shikimate kinase
MSNSRKIIALIGLRCAGKTSVGAELARILRLPFVDLDREIERMYAGTSATLTEATLTETSLTEARLMDETLTDDTRPDESRPDDARTNDSRTNDARASEASTDEARPTASKPPPPATRPPTSAPPSAGDILKSQGEPAFRALESQALAEIVRREAPCVLATGGGVIEREENRRALAEHALCIWLRADPAELARRLRADRTPRPPLTGEDAASEIPKLALRRDPLYAALAHTTLDTAGLPPAALAERLARELRAGKDLDPRG